MKRRKGQSAIEYVLMMGMLLVIIRTVFATLSPYLVDVVKSLHSKIQLSVAYGSDTEDIYSTFDVR